MLTFAKSKDVGDYEKPGLKSPAEILEFEKLLKKSGEARRQLVSQFVKEFVKIFGSIVKIETVACDVMSPYFCFFLS